MAKRMVNHFKKVIPFIIITILAVGGVETFYRVPFTRLMQTSRELKVQDAGTKIVIPVKSEQKKRPDPQTILKRNLFGTPPKGEKAATTEQPAPVATALELSLVGTITGPPNSRRAILLDKKKKVQDIYYQGDTVQGALIKEIQRGKIILNVNGKEEILVPETPKTNPSGATNPNPSSSIPPEMGQGPAPEIPAEAVVEPEPIITTEAPEPAEPIINATVESNAPNTNLPNTNKRPNTNNNQEKP
jgi:type II secretory pathway component PulC